MRRKNVRIIDQLTRDERRLYSRIGQYVDWRYTGYTGAQDSPRHRNGKNNPLPCTQYRRPDLREPSRLGWADWLAHLESDKDDPREERHQHQYITNCVDKETAKRIYRNRQVHLLAIDNDLKHDDGIVLSDAFDLARDENVNVLSGRGFIEPSRGKKGSYVWMKVRRTSAPAVFNKKMCIFSRVLRTKFNGKYVANVDFVKGLLNYESDNEAFDLFAVEEKYKYDYWKQQVHNEGKWKYDRRLETHIHHRGVLVTMPCAGARIYEQHRIASFLKWEADRSNEITEEEINQFIFDVLGPDALDTLIEKEVQIIVKAEAAKEKLNIYDRLARQKKQCKVGENRAWSMLKSPDAWVSSMGAALYSLQTHGIEVDAEQSCGLYEDEGAATGPRTPERLNRHERLLAFFKPHYKECMKRVTDPFWFDADDVSYYEQLLRSRAGQTVYRASLASFGKIDFSRLALFVAIVRKNIKTVSFGLGAAGFKSVANFFKHFGISINGSQIRRLFEIAKALKIVDLKRKHKFVAPGNPENRCTEYTSLFAEDRLEGAPCEKQQAAERKITVASKPPTVAPEIDTDFDDETDSLRPHSDQIKTELNDFHEHDHN